MATDTTTRSATTAKPADAGRVEVSGKPVLPGMFIRAAFARLNKQDSLSAYRDSAAQHGVDFDLVRIERVLVLPFKQFEAFERTGFLTDCDLWGNGGHMCDLPGLKDMTQEEQNNAWRFQSWRLGTLVVRADLGRYDFASAGCWANLTAFVVDAQGYRYARYVGLHPTPADAPAWHKGDAPAKPDLSALSLIELEDELLRRGLSFMIVGDGFVRQAGRGVAK